MWATPRPCTLSSGIAPRRAAHCQFTGRATSSDGRVMPYHDSRENVPHMCHEFEPLKFEDKVFSVSEMSSTDISAASVVLTRAFAASPQYIPIQECKEYCRSMLDRMPEGAMLVGKMHPVVADEDPSPSWLPEGQESRIVATASISFCSKSRENFLSLKPPDDDAYLCNIAVDTSFRRMGLAKHMLQCVEHFSQSQGYHTIYLHVRLGDEAAMSLYEQAGYKQVAADSWLVKLQNRTPNALYCKEI
ncbi:hypothetical protein M9435_005460 [Picochlorum sp. BPE23]|nr:hypothetical protein M9435_005460 [Picochlorum sp. BPE23]